MRQLLLVLAPRGDQDLLISGGVVGIASIIPTRRFDHPASDHLFERCASSERA